jgi:hypothetical protein
LPRFFPSKFISKCCNFSRDWDRVKGFSALVKRYIMIDLGSFLASHKSKIFLAMRGTPPPSNPPNRRGHIPLLATPWCIFWMGAAPKKCSIILATFLKQNHVFGAQIGHFFTFLRPKKGGPKVRWSRIYEVKG